MNHPWPRQPFLRPAIEPVESVESDDLSRFEGEGGLEAPVQASNLLKIEELCQTFQPSPE